MSSHNYSLSGHGYHLKDIAKGVNGEISKIEEELFELHDANEQKSKIMALVELSDLIGAIELYVDKYHQKLSEIIPFELNSLIKIQTNDHVLKASNFRGTLDEIKTQLDFMKEYHKFNKFSKQINPISNILIIISLYLKNNYPNFNFNDLVVMKDITKRTFENGHRISSS